MAEKLRLGLVGCGIVMEKKHMPVLRQVDAFDVCAVADPDADRREMARAQFGIENRYGSLEEMLAGAELDAIAVLTPVQQHFPVARAALRAGKAVLVEKPLTLDLDEAAELEVLARQSKMPIMVGFHMRFHAQVQRAQRMIASGELGRIWCIRSTWTNDARTRETSSWRDQRSTGGGAIIELGVHVFDLWRYLLEGDIVDIEARSRSPRWPDETAMVTARMSHGVLATAVLSEVTQHNITIEIHAEKGQLTMACLRYDGFTWEPVSTAPGGGRNTLARLGKVVSDLPRGIANFPGGDYLASYRDEWRHFADCIRDGTPVASPISAGTAATRAALAAVASIESAPEARGTAPGGT